MSLNDELYSRLVNLYQDLDDQKINQLNARLILYLIQEIPNKKVLTDIFVRLQDELKSGLSFSDNHKK